MQSSVKDSKVYITQQVSGTVSGRTCSLRLPGCRKVMGPGCIIGNTENPQTMATWVYSMDAVMTLTGDLKRMGDRDDEEMKVKHKVEFLSRIRHDGDDKRAIR